MAGNSLISASLEHPPIELLNLLILDDERAVREGCREAAVSLGYRTFVAENAETAYKLLETHAIDVVMLDLKFPGSSGFESLREIKRRRPQAEGIVISSNSSLESGMQAMRYGAYDYVTKPFDLDELKLLLERVAGHVKLGSENRFVRQNIKLDEIGELGTDLQVKLLRALQEKEIRPVGATRPLPINVRILAATNRNLDAAVEQGSFRRDLYFRLNVLSLRIPPLRERKQDIPLLVGHFLDRLSRLTGAERIISDEAIKIMLAYDWPGNVRELENCLERASAMSSGPLIHSGDLPTPLQNSMRQQASVELRHTTIIPIAQLEREAILNALRQLKGDKLEPANKLGMRKTTLYRKIREYHLEDFGIRM